MKREDIQLELDQVYSLISRKPSGLSREELSQQLKPDFSSRTLLRRLEQLKNKGLIAIEGRGKQTRYIDIKSRPQPDNSYGQSIELSPEAAACKALIKQPQQQRLAREYQRNFLLDYTPNRSAYLTAAQKESLYSFDKSFQGEAAAGTFAKKILDRLLIDLSWNSSRLEGNTYSLLETEQLIHQGIATEGKDLFETRMILNHKAAIEFLVENADELSFSRFHILNLHALLSKNLLSDPSASGRLRTISVGIGKTNYQPLSLPQLIEEYFEIILQKANQISCPFEQAFFAMVHIPYLQAFVDVNKRVSRLAANIPLIKNNLCPISFVDLPKEAYIDATLCVYEYNRVELLADIFIWAYEQSVKRYSEAQAFLTQPDIFREKYDAQITKAVQEVIVNLKTKPQAIDSLQRFAHENLPTEDTKHFIEVCQEELLALHDGNIAKYQISLKSYLAWKQIWDGIFPSS